MKKVRLNELENNKNNKLKQYKLDKDSINEFRSKIKQVSDEESEKLALELFELIKNDNFDDDYLKVTELIYNGADVNYYSEYYELFDICIKNNNIKAIVVLLRAGININVKDKNGITPLMLCSKVGNKDILELLILMGADVNIKNNIGENALSIALKNNNKECANILINAQAHLNYRNICNDSIIDINKNNLSIPILHDKSVYPIIDKIPKDLIKEAEDKLNNLENNVLIDDTINPEVTLLTEEQIFKDNKLDIIKIYGTQAVITDFAILLGGFVSVEKCFNEGNTLKDRTGDWWTQTYKGFGRSGMVGVIGDQTLHSVKSRMVGIRPVIPYSLISSEVSNKKITDYGVVEIEYGEYPQTIVDEYCSNILETKYKERILKNTGKYYTTDSISAMDLYTKYSARAHVEYELNGRKYIRFISNMNNYSLSDGRMIKIDKPYWIQVEPITWLVDEKTNIALSKKILVSGLQFVNSIDYKGDFENSDIYKYLNKVFVKDIIPSNILENSKQLKKSNIQFEIHSNKLL